jgi:hypothetical protein
MKGDLKHAHSDWMRLHPGKRISIYDVPGLTKGPYERRFTVENIKAAFAACGIHPFNRFAIPEYFFAPAQVTDLATGKLQLHLIKHVSLLIDFHLYILSSSTC